MCMWTHPTRFSALALPYFNFGSKWGSQYGRSSVNGTRGNRGRGRGVCGVVTRLLSLEAYMVSVMLSLGDPRYRLQMQLLYVSSKFSTDLLPCYFILDIYAPLFIPILLMSLMLHVSPMFCLFMFLPP